MQSSAEVCSCPEHIYSDGGGQAHANGCKLAMSDSKQVLHNIKNRFHK